MQKWEYLTVEVVSMVGSMLTKNNQKIMELDIG